MLPWPGPVDSISLWESYWAQVAILRNLPHRAESIPPQNSVEMQGDFPTVTPKSPVSARFLVNRFSHSRSWLPVFSLIFATFTMNSDSTENKETTRLAGSNTYRRKWKARKDGMRPFAQAVEGRPLQSHTQNWERQIQQDVRGPQQDVRGPCSETAVPSPLSSSDKQKRRKYEKPTHGKEGTLSDLKSWGNSTSRACLRSWALYRHPLYPLKELQGNQGSESLTSHFQAHRT